MTSMFSDVWDWVSTNVLGNQLPDERTTYNKNAQRFLENADNGIIMYGKETVEKMILQFENLRCDKYEDILVELNKDLKANHDNISWFWNEAKKTYDKNPQKYKSKLKMRGGQDFPDECHIALICYTLGNLTEGLFANFNKECREHCSGKRPFDQIKNKSFFFLLRYAMEKQAQDGLPVKFYRGCRGRFASEESDQVKGFGQFTSVTAKKFVGEFFASSSGTEFVITDAAKPQSFPTKFISMKYHSVQPCEDEFLLSPFQLYFITGFERNQTHDIVYLSIF